MRRMHWFEFGDQPWCPNAIRRGITEFLATIARVTKLYTPTADVINDLMTTSGQKNIVALAAGSGGGILDIRQNLQDSTEVVLTDIFPSRDFIAPDSRLVYYKDPVDATQVPRELIGVRVMYSAFHHFATGEARKVLADAVECNQPIAIFEATERSFKGILSILFVPIILLILIPTVRPFRWNRLFLTYLIPVLPLVLFWDGLVSALRTYSASELQDLTAGFPQYHWKVMTLKGPHQENILALTGVPTR